jgi:hypothetical protein
VPASVIFNPQARELRVSADTDGLREGQEAVVHEELSVAIGDFLGARALRLKAGPEAGEWWTGRATPEGTWFLSQGVSAGVRPDGEGRRYKCRCLVLRRARRALGGDWSGDEAASVRRDAQNILRLGRPIESVSNDEPLGTDGGSEDSQEERGLLHPPAW